VSCSCSLIFCFTVSWSASGVWVRDSTTTTNFSEGSPSEKVAAGYVWTPGTELSLPGHERPVARDNGRRRP
jgi:hypothetical protein